MQLDATPSVRDTHLEIFLLDLFSSSLFFLIHLQKMFFMFFFSPWIPLWKQKGLHIHQRVHIFLFWWIWDKLLNSSDHLRLRMSTHFPIFFTFLPFGTPSLERLSPPFGILCSQCSRKRKKKKRKRVTTGKFLCSCIRISTFIKCFRVAVGRLEKVLFILWYTGLNTHQRERRKLFPVLRIKKKGGVCNSQVSLYSF